jgi:D-alanyl-D-alanine carboxypeptidase (penicillin-binding protein 5/6)
VNILLEMRSGYLEEHVAVMERASLSRPVFRVIVVFACLLGISPAQALPIIPAPPVIAADGHILMDFNSGTILTEKGADTRMEPASLTKLMTALIVFQELKAGNIQLDEMVTISEKAWRSEGSRTFVEVGKQVSVEDLVMGMIVQSGNDATIALAEYIAGSEDVFAAAMNQKAQEVGMTQSNFVNSTGLPHPDHFTTPRDLATLTRVLIRD